MKHQIVTILLLTLSGVCLAGMEGRDRTMPRIKDPSMVIKDGGSEIEVMPDRRAVVGNPAARKQTARQVVMAKPDAVITPQSMGVAFNHAMQVQGYLTGEIAFRLKARDWGDAAPAKSLGGFRQLTPEGVYIVIARTPADLVAWTKSLQQMKAIAWVEPIVLY